MTNRKKTDIKDQVSDRIRRITSAIENGSRLPLASVLWQLRERKSCLVLYVRGGSIHVDRGEVIHAQIRDIEGQAALAELLSASGMSTIHTSPPTDCHRTISDPLEVLLDAITSSASGARPVPVDDGTERAASHDSGVERVHSVSYASFRSFSTPNDVPQLLGEGTEAPSHLATHSIAPAPSWPAGDTAPSGPVPRARKPLPVIVPVAASVLLTLILGLVLVFALFSERRQPPPLFVSSASGTGGKRQPKASSRANPDATEQRRVLVRTRPDKLLLLDAATMQPLGISPLHVTVGPGASAYKLVAQLGTRQSPVLEVAPKENENAVTLDLSAFAAGGRKATAR